MVLESGTRVRLAFTRERTRGVTPAGIGTPVDDVAAAADGGAAGLSKLTRASGSWIDDGFAVGQMVKAEGFADTDINANWRIAAVTATDLTVEDPGDVIDDEIAATGQKVRIMLQTLRSTSRAVNLQKEVLTSEEVDTETRQVSDVRHGFNQVVGNPGFQLSRSDYRDLIEAAFGAVFTAPTAVSGVDLATTQGTKTYTRASGSFSADGYRVGDIIIVAGFTNTESNGLKTIATVGTTTITVVEDIGADEVAAAGRTIQMQGKRCDIGTTLSTLYVERHLLATGKYQKFNGVTPNQLAMSIAPRAIVNGTMDLLGMSAKPVASASESGEDPISKSAASPYAAFDGKLYEGAALIAVVTGLEWTLANNRSLEPVIGSKFSPDVFEGDAVVTGQVTAFFENDTLLNKFINETESSIWNKLDDPNGTDFCNMVFPRVKYNGGDMDPPQRGPVPLQMPFQALLHATYKTSMWIQFSDL